MFERKIFIASQDGVLRKKLKSLFLRNGFAVVGEADDGVTTLRMVHAIEPDLVVLDYDLPGMTALELGKIITDDRVAPIIMIAPTWENGLSKIISTSWIFAYLLRPIDESNLLVAAETALINYERMLKLEKEILKLKDTIESRKIVERAKGLLMEDLGLTEAEAFSKIQHQSMDKGIPMKKVAEAIILTYDIGEIKK